MRPDLESTDPQTVKRSIRGLVYRVEIDLAGGKLHRNITYRPPPGERIGFFTEVE